MPEEKQNTCKSGFETGGHLVGGVTAWDRHDEDGDVRLIGERGS